MKTKEETYCKKAKGILLFAILAFSLAILSLNASAKVFTIQNESVNQFVVNGSSGNIILNPNAGFGNVGIGTTSPNYLLQVASGTDGRSVNLSNVLFVNGSSGNVGIGTATPIQKLSLNAGNFLQTINGSLTRIGGNQIGTRVRSIYVVNDYAYIGITSNTGNDFMILDISNATNTSRGFTVNNVSGIDMGGNVNSVFVNGKYAYLATGVSNNFVIVDVSNVTAPKNVSSLSLQSGQAATGIYVSGKYAYLGAATIFSIIDISNPLNPSIVSSSLGVGGGITSIYVIGKYAYVGATGFSIIDISNPINPVMVGSLGTGAGVQSVYVSGKYAYITTTQNVLNDFYIVDVSNPLSPKNISGINLPGGVGGTSISVNGKYAYIGTDFSTIGVLIADISDPMNPIVVGTATTNSNIRSSFVNGKYLYVGSDSGNEFQIFDINGIDIPAAIIGSLKASTLSTSGNVQIGNDLYVNNGIVAGNGGILSQGPLSISTGSSNANTTAFKISNANGDTFSIRDNGVINISGISISTNNNNTLNILGNVNLSNALFVNSTSGNVGIGTSTPIQKLSVNSGNFLQTINGSLRSLGSLDVSVGINSIYVANGYAYLGLGSSSGSDFIILDVSNVTNANGSITVSNISGANSLDFGGVTQVFVNGKYAYVAHVSGFTIVDVSNATAPKNVSSIGTQNNELYVSGKYAYLGSGQIVDISNPLSPIIVGTYGGTVAGAALFVSGKYLYGGSAGVSGDEFNIIDVSNPSAPFKVGGTEIGGQVYEIYVSGRYAYLTTFSNAQGEFIVMDVSNPVSPVNVSSVEIGTEATNLYVAGKYAYVTSQNLAGNELTVIDISNPLSPTKVGGFDAGGNLWSVFADGKYLYVGGQTTGLNGFNILDISNIDAPAATIGSLKAGTLSTSGNVQFGNDLYVTSGLIVGNGILSQGPLGITTAGANKSTTALKIINSLGTNLFTVRDDGAINMSGVGFTQLNVNGILSQTSNDTILTIGSKDIGVRVRTIYAANGYAYVGITSNTGNDFLILDVSNATNSSKVFTVNNISGIDMGGDVNSIQVAGKYAYVGHTNGFTIVDVSNASNPKNVSSIRSSAADGVYISGKYAYFGVGTAINIVDISNPLNPLLVSSSLGIGGTISSIYVKGIYAYAGATSGATDFSIIDVSNPISPVLVGSLGTGAGVQDLAVSGRYAYIAVTNNALEDFYVIDIQNPSSPRNISRIELGGGAAGLAISVAGRYAYLGTSNSPNFLKIIDISDPYNPSITGGAVVNRNIYSVFISGKYAYVGTEESNSVNEFQILDIFGIDSPSATIGSIDTNHLAVKGNARIENDLYVSNGLIVGNGILSQGPVSIFSDNTTNAYPALHVVGSVKISALSTSNATPILNITNSTGQTNCVFTNNGDFYCKGTKSAFIDIDGFAERKLFAVESPDVRHIDEGRAKLKNGYAKVSIDPIFRETIEGDYNVYVTPEGKTKALYVAEKANDYFIVKDTAKTNAVFSYIISAYRKGYESKRFDSGSDIEIIAIIDEENKVTDVEVKGTTVAQSIPTSSGGWRATVNTSSATNYSLPIDNSSNVSLNNLNQTNSITGNAINDVGLETDLSNILEPESNATSTTTEASIVFENNSNVQTFNASVENATNNATAGSIPTQSEEQNNNETITITDTTYKYTGQTADNTFTIYSTDENEIIKQIEQKTKLDKGTIKRAIKFKHKEPIKDDVEESIEESQPASPSIVQLGYITKVNGSVIIRLG